MNIIAAMKTIELQIPEGKKAEWINGVLTLVDEERPVTERIKTFQDAMDALGENHPFVQQYMQIESAYRGDDNIADFIAYLKLRIIVAALNEGWEPQFTEDEYRWYPWFYLYTQQEIDKMSDKERRSCVLRSGYHSDANSGLAYAYANYASSHSHANFGARLAFKTRELAKYAGEQFTEIWADYVFKEGEL